MWDEVIKSVAGQSPVVATILILGLQALQIWKEDLRLRRLIKDSIEQRLGLVEKMLKLPEATLETGFRPDDLPPT